MSLRLQALIFQYLKMPSTHKRAPPFLIKTYGMLQNPALSQIIQWNEEGTGFMIANSTDFSAKVLPLYFKHSNMHSYIRQLNMYGFSKKHGKNSNYYHHPHFLRGQQPLISLIQRRVENKGPKVDRPSTVSIESQQTQPLHDKLQQANHFLLVQQIANLQAIVNEVKDERLRESLAEAARLYTNSQYELKSKIGSLKGEEQVKTTETLRGKQAQE